jgi:rhamnopyranosyl-N-acetylglucosaminyl-diphospho-decaprenol beta-1,3/1,4-galactofuranosyltransferase
VIAAVVPAYQRAAELTRCVDRLLAEVGVNRVYVVNNGPAAVTFTDSRISTLTPGRNLGVGGGYAAGMKHAIKEGYEWIWLLDDDAWPAAGALSHMLRAAEACSPSPAAVVPAVRDEQGNLSLPAARRSNRWLLRFSQVLSIDDRADCEIAIAAWAGLLVKAEAVMSVGLPDAQMFIDGDDTEFTYRLGRAGPILLAPHAIVWHPQPAGGSNVLPLWRSYYDIRNTIVFVIRHQERRWLWPVELARLWVSQLMRIARHARKDRVERVRILIRASADGLSGRSGQRPHMLS